MRRPGGGASGEQAQPWFQELLTRLPLAQDRPFVGYAAAIGLSAAGTIVRWVADDILPAGFPFVAFFPAVIVAAFLFGTRPGACAAVVSGVSAWYLFIPPYNSFGLDFGVALALGFYTAVVSVDIALVHWMQTANARLRAERERSLELVRHRELLFSELQHRVGNNLQMAASLLQLQKRKLTEPEARDAIDEAARRLGLIGRVQRQLYDPAGAQLDLATFLENLANEVLSTAVQDGVALTVEGQSGLTLPPEAAISTALIVAESLANAIEHGFAGRSDGRITIAVQRDGDFIDIAITDDGCGLAADVDARASASLGMRICAMLAKGLDGEYTLQSAGKGCTARLRMPLAS